MKSTLAIDFGTVNTYLSSCSADQVAANGIVIGGATPSMPTAILYRPNQLPLIGSLAVNTYGNAPSELRKSWLFQSQFKPDIASSTKAQETARDFLSAILATAEASNLHLAPSAYQVIFGAPSNSSGQFLSVLKRTALEAGYGKIETYPEPVGALIFHIANKQIPASLALTNGLVVDFGGGTCDFAFLRRGEVNASWGDFELGGRLFDDLFFQWFIEKNANATALMEAHGSAFYVRSEECRKMKEFFSTTIARDPDAKVPYVISPYGQISDMSRDEFIARARRYVMSSQLQLDRRSLAVSSNRLDSGGAVDLIEWFSSSLHQGLLAHGIGSSDIDYVLLAGGSSMWPFVGEIVRDRSGIVKDGLIRSSNPFAAVSEGLATLPGLQYKFEKTVTSIEKEKPSFFIETINPLLDKASGNVINEITERILMRVIDLQVLPEIRQFRNNGGTIANFRSSLEKSIANADIEIQKIVAEAVSPFSEALSTKALSALRTWLAKHDVLFAKRKSDKTDSQNSPVGPIEVPDPFERAGSVIQGLVTAITAVVMASLLGGGGIALLVHGPVGLVIGAVLGVSGAVLVLRYGKKAAKERIESLEISPFLLKLPLSDTMIRKIRSNISDDIRKKIASGFVPARVQIFKELQIAVNQELSALKFIQAI